MKNTPKKRIRFIEDCQTMQDYLNFCKEKGRPINKEEHDKRQDVYFRILKKEAKEYRANKNKQA